MGYLIRGIESILPAAKAGAVTIGNFDGVHRGHRTLLERLRRVADQVDGPAVVLTFDPPPSRLLRPDSAPPALTWMERRADLLFGIGIDAICVCETTPQLLHLEPEAFFQQILLEQFQIRGMVEGPNFRFGKDRRGDVDLLSELCNQSDVRLSIAAAHTDDGEWISSSRIRQLVGQGNLAAANRLLLEPYRLLGIVGRGAARGRQLGFPTANLESIRFSSRPTGFTPDEPRSPVAAMPLPFTSVPTLPSASMLRKSKFTSSIFNKTSTIKRSKSKSSNSFAAFTNSTVSKPSLHSFAKISNVPASWRGCENRPG